LDWKYEVHPGKCLTKKLGLKIRNFGIESTRWDENQVYKLNWDLLLGIKKFRKYPYLKLRKQNKIKPASFVSGRLLGIQSPAMPVSMG